MVVLSEVPNMFWGITLDVGNRYSQTVERSFHISMAAIDPSTVGKGENVSIMLQIEKAEFLLCTLNPGYLQQQLDLNFTEGEEVTFFLKGKGVVHLTGYLVPEEEEYPADMSSMEGEDEEEEESEEEEDEDDSEEDDDEAPELLAMEEYLANGKRKKGQDQDPAVKRMKFDEQEFDSEDEDDEDFSTLNFEEDSDEEGEEDDDEEDDDEDDEDDEDEEDDEDDDDEDDEEDEEEEDLGDSFVQMEAQQKSKKSKAAESPKKQINGVHTSPGKQKTPKGNLTVKEEKKTPKEDKNMKIKQEKTTPKAEKSPKAQKQKTPKEGKTPKDQKTPQESKSPKGQGKGVKKVLAGGVTLEEVKEGHGPEARQGKMVHVYYSGKLDSGKKFDSCVIGKPFKFKLGKGEVVKGWDVGLQGMKVGGKRKLTIPPSFGYGSRKMGPIPANSTLVFDIELKAVS